jgi:hypothetical protein
MLSNLSELQTITSSHGRFSKRCISNISENLLQELMETLHLIKSLKPIVDYFQPTLLICDSGRLMWSKKYIRNIVKLRERSIGITETRQKDHGK